MHTKMKVQHALEITLPYSNIFSLFSFIIIVRIILISEDRSRHSMYATLAVSICITSALLMIKELYEDKN